MKERGDSDKSADRPLSSVRKVNSSGTSAQSDLSRACWQLRFERNLERAPVRFVVFVNHLLLRWLWRVVSVRLQRPESTPAVKSKSGGAKFAIYASILASSAAGPLHAQGNPANAVASDPLRLDRRLGPDEFCSVKLTNGPVLKMPRSLFSEGTCATREPYPTPQVRLTFWYPDMTPTSWPGEMSMVMQKDSGTYQPQTERFRFWIVFLFAPSQIQGATYQQWDGAEPQVWQLLESNRLAKTSYPTPHFSEAKFSGLREIHFGARVPPSAAQIAEAKAKGWDLTDNSHAYVETLGSDYTMLLGCNGGPTCIGHVQLNASHLQYRFYIPSESISNAGDAIAAANMMIARWIK